MSNDNSKTKHVVSSNQFSKNDLQNLFNLADDIRRNAQNYRNILAGKVVATLFYEPSTRTRLSFESAILRLGGMNISTENAKEMSSAIKGETIEDTIRIVQGYADAIVMRHPDNDSMDRAVSVANVPIINAGSGSGEHPTQALLDLYTIFKHKRTLDNLSVGLVGDLKYGRTIHSLIRLLSIYNNVKFYGFSVGELALAQKYVDELQSKGFEYTICHSFDEFPVDLDVLYQTRTQRERFVNEDINLSNLIVDSKVMSHFGNELVLLHPLPRNNEIASEVDADPRARYFEQAHNGMFVRMAIFASLFNS